MAGTAFKVAFEVLRLLKSFKRNIYLQFPWYKLRRVNTSARIVFGDALLQVGGVPDVAIFRSADAFNDVGVKHHANCLGWPAIRSLELVADSPPPPEISKRRFRA